MEIEEKLILLIDRQCKYQIVLNNSEARIDNSNCSKESKNESNYNSCSNSNTIYNTKSV